MLNHYTLYGFSRDRSDYRHVSYILSVEVRFGDNSARITWTENGGRMVSITLRETGGLLAKDGGTDAVYFQLDVQMFIYLLSV